MQHFNASDGVRLAYTIDDFTDPWLKAPTLLLLHAAMGHSQRYYAWVPRLCRHYRVVRMDLRGHGESAVPPAEPALSMERLVKDMAELLDHLGLQERAHRRQLGRRLYRPAACDDLARAREEPDAVRLDAGPEEQPGRNLDSARREGRPAQVPRRHDLRPLPGRPHRSAPHRMVPRRGGEERHGLHRALRRPDGLARMVGSAAPDQVPDAGRLSGRRDGRLDARLRRDARPHPGRRGDLLRGPAAQHLRQRAGPLRRRRARSFWRSASASHRETLSLSRAAAAKIPPCSSPSSPS